MKKKLRWAVLLILTGSLLLGQISCATRSSQDDETASGKPETSGTETETKPDPKPGNDEKEGGMIDLYLIAGQSNGAGFSALTEAFRASDPLFTQGYSHILYCGNSAATYGGGKVQYLPRVVTLQETVAGLGKDASYFGPELGMAKALSAYYNAESGKKAGIIKYAAGGTTLSDVTGGRYPAAGNWASPSYLRENGAKGALSGGLYRNFIKQVQTGIAEYEKAGYTVAIKGLFWMQGESDSKLSGITSTYPHMFECLVQDMRKDLGKMTGTDLSALPILVGEISDAYNIRHLETSAAFIAMQNRMVNAMEHVYIVRSGVFGVGTDATDASHWTSDDMLTIGQMVGTQFLNVCKGVKSSEPIGGDAVASVYSADGQPTGTYSSLSYAVNVASAGSTVKLLRDLELYGNLNINNRNPVTLDGNGFRINSHSVTHGVRLVECNVTLRNFDFYHCTNSASAYGIYVYEDATLVFESGELSAHRFGIVVNQDSTVTVNGGTISIRNGDAEKCGALYVSYGGSPAPTRNNSSQITVNGGTLCASGKAAAIYISDVKGNCAAVRLQAGTISAASRQNAVRVVSKTATCQIGDNIIYVTTGKS